MSDTKITLYNAVICPYAQRAVIALKESGADYEIVNIDLYNKPAWYKDINPETKVPALNAEGQNIAESLVIIEYINDRFPEAGLMPKEAIKKANVRFVIDFFSSKVNAAFFKYLMGNRKEEGAFETFDKEINASLDRLNELLVQQSETGPYFLGDKLSLADIAIAPFLLRILAFNKYYLNKYELEAVKKHTRLAEFFKGITTHPTITESYCGDEVYTEVIAKKYGLTKD